MDLGNIEEAPLGEALSIGDLPDEFGDISDIDNFDFLGDEDTPDPNEDAQNPPPASVEAGDISGKPGEGTKEGETAPDPQAAEKLDAYEKLDAALRDSPGEAIKAIFAGMNPQARAALAGELWGAPAPPAGAQQPTGEVFDIDGYDPQGDMEIALKSKWNDIQAIPSIIQMQDETDQRVQQGFSAFVPHVTDANIAAQLALAKVEAICAAIGIELPDPDGGAVIKTLQGGNTTYRDAVRKSTNYKGQVDAHKQTRTPRPETIGGGTRTAEKIPVGTDAVAIARRLGVLPPR